jgi:hypothetical protein
VSPTFSHGSTRSAGRGHSRTQTDASPNFKRVSPPPITASIAETIHDNQVVILEQDNSAPPILAELQHLAGPPPPPPPPVMGHSPRGSLGVINIAIDENTPEKIQEATSPVAASPSTHRRGRGSVSENIGMTFKRVTERMRSTSRSRNKSPPMGAREVAPYESIPEFAFPRGAGTRSPSDASESQFGTLPPPPPPPPPQPMEQVIPPGEESQNSQFAGYRHPKEVRANVAPDTLQQNTFRPVRANMPPEQLQPGVYHATETPMI